MSRHRMASNLFLALLVFVRPALAQGPPLGPARGAVAERASTRVVFEGFVLDFDGAPAEGAVVVSSAGGRAVTDARGDYRLELEVPLDVERVQLRAVAAGEGLSASTSLSLPRAAGSATRLVLVDPLRLSGAPSCEPSWLPTFGGEPGVSGFIEALAVFDDGHGPALFVGGIFPTANGTTVNNIARWDGSRWSALAGGVNSIVEALVVHDDGTGPALYAGGGFWIADGMPANRVARWNGSSWSAIGSPFASGASVEALAVHDDGSGPALYAAGFNGHVAKWDGAAWSELPHGPDNTIFALASFDDGSGPALYAGGLFRTVNGVPMPGVARWDGSGWSGVGGGRDGIVNALIVHDDGSGPALYAGGSFTSAGGVVANRIARWNGSAWSSLGGGLNRPVHALTVHDDGGGPALYAGGGSTPGGGQVARWNGTSWADLGSGANGEVHALAGSNDGTGARLYAGGWFSMIGGLPANRFASWDGTSWAAYGDGPSSFVAALAAHDDGSGPALYAGGFLLGAGGVVLNRIGRWDGAGWSALGTGFDGRVLELTVHDDGAGPALYASGPFSNAGGSSANSVAKWDGTAWSRLGNGIGVPANPAFVHALVSHDDGSGPALFAGGDFGAAGGVPASNIARWNGSSWAALTGGGLNSSVRDLLVFDDGGGPALYAAGMFNLAGPTMMNFVAKWNGSGWSALGAGLNGAASALVVHDDGRGPALYVGGAFTRAGGLPAARIARWDGSSWSPVGGGLGGNVDALVVHDDGAGAALYAGGSFTTAGQIFANRIARWDGRWTSLGGGLSGQVLALAVFDGPEHGGPALFAGGDFGSAFDSGDSYLAKWGCLVVGCTSVVLDFETEDDFVTPLGNGQKIDSEFGDRVVISGAGANAGPTTFDTTPGGPNDPALNDDMLIGHGNVLLLEDDWYAWAQSTPGFFDAVTDDPHGGDLILDFTAPVDPRSLLLADINPPPNQGASVTLVDEAGRTRVYSVEPGWTGTYGNAGPHKLDLTMLAPQPGNGTSRFATAVDTPGFLQDRVVKIVVHLTGYGAIDELEFCH